MRIASTHVAVAFVAALGVVGLSWSGVFSGPCERPLDYKIGTIDSRFNIATSTVRDLLTESESVWEAQADRELFTYSSEADFTVNFIFDERQQTTNAVNEYESTLSDLELSHSEVAAEHQKRKERYEDALADYQNDRAEYEADLSAHNERVRKWNDRGGAPEDVYEDLREERQQLDERLQSLQRQQAEVEELRLAVNELVTQGNSLARAYNQTASTFSDRFGESREFNQATYTGDAINVYQFEQPDDLKLALMHEFGHALGIEHVSGSSSVMYYLMENQPLDDPQLSQFDIEAFNDVCGNA